MARIIKSISIDFYDEKKITEYCAKNNISFSKFVQESALKRISEDNQNME